MYSFKLVFKFVNIGTKYIYKLLQFQNVYIMLPKCNFEKNLYVKKNQTCIFFLKETPFELIKRRQHIV